MAQLIEELKKLPGVGPKSAQRMAFHILRSSEEDAESLATSIRNLKEKLHLCSVCNNITDIDPCTYCSNLTRNQLLVCVVAEPTSYMKAAVLTRPQDVSRRPLQIAEVPKPQVKPGHVVLRVRACGVCRTDLHIVEGELPPRKERIIPGHQIVGEVVDGGTAELPAGMRVGVSWIGGVDGTCWYCRRDLENLCDSPTFTGYSVDGGYAEYAVARNDFLAPLPATLDDLQAAPLLCAGIIGFRSLRVAGVMRGERVGLFGFGASAHLAIAVLKAWQCEVYVSTRG